MTQQEPRQKLPTRGTAAPGCRSPSHPKHPQMCPTRAPHTPRAAGTHWVVGVHGTGGLQGWAGAASSSRCPKAAGQEQDPPPSLIQHKSQRPRSLPPAWRAGASPELRRGQGQQPGTHCSSFRPRRPRSR